MTDGAMMSITLKTADGSELIIHRVGVDTSGLKSMKIGDRIKVTYTGVIKGNDTSRAFITKLENA
jgi:phosphotransferase system IIA component